MNNKQHAAWFPHLKSNPHGIIIGCALIIFIVNTIFHAPQYIPGEPPLPEFDQVLGTALKIAHQDAEQFASQELDRWISQLIQRIDYDFLDWYFSYWNQTVIELQSLYHETIHLFYKTAPSATEKLTEKINMELSKRVFRPQIAQMELEAITRNTLNRYLQTFRKECQTLPKQYKIPQGSWQRYLNDLALITTGVYGERNLFATIKNLYTSSIGSALVITSAIPLFAGKISVSIAEKLAKQIWTKVTLKSSGKAAAQFGGRMLGLLLALASWPGMSGITTTSKKRINRFSGAP